MPDSIHEQPLPTLQTAAEAAHTWLSGYTDGEERPEFSSDGEGVNSEAIYMELCHALGARPWWEHDNPTWSFDVERRRIMEEDGHV